MTTKGAKNVFGYKDVIGWGIFVIGVMLAIKHFSAEGAFIWMTIVTMFAPIFVRSQLNEYTYEKLKDNWESNDRVVDSYKIKSVAYFSVDVVLWYTYIPLIMTVQFNIWFNIFATLFTWLASGIIFAVIVIMIVQGIILWIKPEMSQSGRKQVETYVPWALAGLVWMSVIFGGRRK